MTELETLLLSALEDLQKTYKTHEKTWQQERAALHAMFEATQQDNAALREQLDRLSGQFSSLSALLSRSGIT
ncbi:MbeD family mobilization/exclusion protein [Bombella sp. ESL0378]|uniref:MbeD family mobilization/exclusion protein n=1 Tax=Bombella sp. ESL0378 TaxID=2676442 RepID=UPI0012D902D0|nr:MbeD family mobilization/exclusion protein [Bombella sp. ESL0378]MUG05572.1 MbeD family mobilization/exclusion protein [Bombella sp. ESL0378]